MEKLDEFTIIACGIIAIITVLFWWYIKYSDKDKLKNNIKWINQIPSIISTLGVLGTFIGITKGLWNFDAADINKSIPTLLNGLKTAFFTSLFGMIGSMFLNRTVSHKLDQIEGDSDISEDTKSIIRALNDNNRDLVTKIENESQNFVSAITENDNIQGIHQDVGQLKDDVEEIKGLIQQIQTYLVSIQKSSLVCADEISRLRAVLVTATASTSAIDNNIADINDKISNIEQLTENIRDQIDE